MKITLSWLKDHLETNAPVEKIAETLTHIGLEVEAVEDRAKTLAAFTVALVKECTRHPNADKLTVCQVDNGREALQVVCGAPNARAGMKAVFAPAGAIVPGTGLELKVSSIRGVASNGMLLSEFEMGLSQEHEGIIELPASAKIGAPVAEVMGLNDPVLEIKLTPNRADCAGVHGIARDLAAAGIGTLKARAIEKIVGKFANPIKTALNFPKGKESACPLFAGRLIRNVRNGHSPDWLQHRLAAVGLRPISALVDITNYLSLDRARPLHVFDADKLKGDLTARLAKDGETLEALDGRSYTLDAEMCVIADAKAARGIAGVMGGSETSCAEMTKNVFIEAALFDPTRTAATGRKRGIVSDARYRFERGVDPEFCLPGLELATRMILEFCGGEASEVVAAGRVPEWRRVISFDPKRVEKLTGLALPESEIARILTSLGFKVDGKGALSVTPPSWRADVQGAADLVEEVVRIAGLEKIPSAALPRPSAVTRPVLTAEQKRVREAKRALASRGLMESVNYSFVARAQAELFGGVKDELLLANPISAELDAMRPSLLPSLIAAASRNAKRGLSEIAIFEVAPHYHGGEPGEQAMAASGIRAGNPQRHWTGQARKPDAFAAKADAVALLEALGAPVASLQTTMDAPSWYHPGRSGCLRMGPKTALAAFGEIHPKILRAMDASAPLCAFEVMLGAIPPPKAKPTKAKLPLALSDYPAVERDFAFVVEAKTPAAEIIRAAQSTERGLIESVSVFDVYEGAGIPEGRKSIAIAVRLQPKERTMTDAEIEDVARRIVEAVMKATGGVLRA